MTQRITVIDTETADFDGGICEIACVELEQRVSGRWNIDRWAHTLVRPDRPISPEAMAVHHITEDMVRSARPIDEVLSGMLGELMPEDGSVVLAAHNAPFDSDMLPEAYRAHNLLGRVRPDGRTDTPTWLCTHRCALHLWPDAPRYGNQVLRYWLNLDVSDMPEDAGGIVHRALYDTWCTARMLQRMLTEYSVEHLVQLSGQPVTLQTMGFGKHAGRTFEWMSRFDRGYLDWITNKSTIDDLDVLHTARLWLGQGRLL